MDSIAFVTYVVLGLVMTFGLIIVGCVLLARAGSNRRKAQIDYLGWLAAQGYQVPHLPSGMPLSMYPPQVVRTGSGLRIWGWILVAVGAVFLLARISANASGI